MTKPLLTLVPAATRSSTVVRARRAPRTTPVVSADLFARATMAMEQTRLLVAMRCSRMNASPPPPLRHMLEFIAHDLANDLGAAQLSLAAFQHDRAIVGMGALPPYLCVVQRALVNMGYLVEDLRDARDMQLGRFVVSRDAAVPPEALVSAAVDAAAGYAGGRHLELACAPRLSPVCVDERRIQRVFANLIGNAMKVTDLDGTISVGARPGSTSDDVMFFVRDNGEGMTDAEQNRIFEPSWRGRAGRRPGSGLGLTISRGIVEAHGGRMFVTSHPDIGSTFSFTLPIANG